jgi:acetyltransferase-like isoleucine patch superfamily enzyme
MSLLDKLTCTARRWRFRLQGVSIGASDIGPGVVVRPGKGHIAIGDGCSLETGVILDAYGGRIDIAPWVFIGPYATIYGHGGISIGEGCLIAMHCRILSSNHTAPPQGTPIRSQPDILLPTKIGRDVWLGAGVTVLGGVTIGDGCIVGAGAVVSKDLPPGAIAYGVPAKVQSYRPGATPANP